MPQGKSVYEAPEAVKELKRGEEDDDEEEEESKEEVQEPEVGPEALSPILADQGIEYFTIEHGTIPAWSARVCSKLSSIKFSPITLRSNRWPGAFALAYNDKFANIYIGDGHKDFGNPSQNFCLPPLPPVQKEYAVEGPSENAATLVEQADPTVEDEKKFEDSKKPPSENKPEEEAEDDNEEDGEEEGKEED